MGLGSDTFKTCNISAHITLDSGNVSLEKQLMRRSQKQHDSIRDKVLVFLSNIYLRTIFLTNIKKDYPA